MCLADALIFVDHTVVVSIGAELSSVHLDEMIGSFGRGIAKAQYELDLTSIRIATAMSGVDEGDRVALGAKSYSLLELGLTPTFYQFVDSVIEAKVSISMRRTETTRRSEAKASVGLDWGGIMNTRASATAVNASYARKYDYSAEGSSVLRTKLVPVPPPTLFSQRVRALLDEREAG